MKKIEDEEKNSVGWDLLELTCLILFESVKNKKPFCFFLGFIEDDKVKTEVRARLHALEEVFAEK
ncbi:MAG: hypothetical protein PHT51_01920 [Patescibacteria group bacterium]|nr:hypothetical protein [Patescibacteria group bacterium]MDD4610345.1 hypothetical protein [Patescibacteria group bacterium]